MLRRPLLALIVVFGASCLKPESDEANLGVSHSARVFFSDGYAVRELNPDAGSALVVVPGEFMTNFPTALAVDPSAHRLYWADNASDAVARVGYDGTASTALYTSTDPFSNPAGVAIDVAHDRLFFAEGPSLKAAKLDGSGPITVVPGTVGLDFVDGVAVNPDSQRVCWADNGTDSIRCADYDGNNSVTLHTAVSNFDNPRGLAIDVAHTRLFWAEGNDVKTCQLDGSGFTTVVVGNSTTFPTAVAVDPSRQRLYWTDNGDDTLNVADYAGNGRQLLFRNPNNFSNPSGVAVDPGN